jgi:hypothetical protein
VRFLEFQEQLRDLTLATYNPNLALKPTALPKLARVNARPSWLRVIILGRPVCDVTFRDAPTGAIVDLEF